MKANLTSRSVGKALSRLLPPEESPVSPDGEAYLTSQAGLAAAVSATIGAGVWAVIALLARAGSARVGAIELLFLFAPLVMVPLGLELGRSLERFGWCGLTARRLQPAGATFALVALLLPPGRAAAAFAAGWMLVCLLMAWNGAATLARSLSSAPSGPQFEGAKIVRAALGIGQIDLAVGAAALVLSRFGLRPLGIQEPIVLLTAVHFHYAGFATATIAAATLSFARGSVLAGWLKKIVLLVAVLPFAVAAGFVISPALKTAAALAFSASVAALAVALRASCKQVHERAARGLLHISAGAVFAGMVLAAIYAVVDFRGGDSVTITQMAKTHGLLNAFGYCLPALLGWLIEFGNYPPR